MDKWLEELPQDVTDKILNLCSLRDTIRMGSVSKSGHSLSKQNIRTRPQLPWLMMISNPNSKLEQEEEARCFFSLSDRTIHSIKIPEIRGKCCCGSFNNGKAIGWLMTTDSNLEIRLLHPWRGIQMQLPHYSTIYSVDYNPYFIRQWPQFTIRKAAMSDDAAVVAVINEPGKIAFYRTREDEVWTRISCPFDQFYNFHDIIYHKGQFYVVGRDGKVGVLRINTAYPYVEILSEVIVKIEALRFHGKCSPQAYHRNYLVADSASESLFIVRRVAHWPYNKNGFEVYELELQGSTKEYKKNAAVEVESLGDRVMFLGLSSSILVMARQFSGLKGNCIYFTDDHLRNTSFANESTDMGILSTDMGIFHMEDKTIQPLFQDRAHPLFSPPIWITPPGVESITPSQIPSSRQGE